MLALGRAVRQGKSVAVAVDGPRGPCCKVKPGVIAVAAASGRPVVPVVSAARRRVVLSGAWDRFHLPLPFTRAVVVFGEPMDVAGAAGENLARAASVLEGKLQHLGGEAEKMVGNGGG